jgi:lysozyme
MQLSAEGLALLKSLEGVMPEPYRDSAGLLTIACGHLMTRDEISSGKIYCGDQVLRWKDGPLSDAQIDALLREDVSWSEACIEACVNVQLTQNQYDALVIFAYNIGPNAFRESTLCRLLNEGLYDEIPTQLARWARAGGQVIPGLVRRRAREIAHWHGETTLA